MSQIKTIAKNINRLRTVSIAKLANKAGISQFTLQNILYAKKNDVQLSTISKIAKALGVPIDDLLK